jgi:hypothetical protein
VGELSRQVVAHTGRSTDPSENQANPPVSLYDKRVRRIISIKDAQRILCTLDRSRHRYFRHSTWTNPVPSLRDIYYQTGETYVKILSQGL